MSLVTIYVYSVLGILQFFLRVACFAVFLCIVTWYFIRGASLLQPDFRATVHADAAQGDTQHVACCQPCNRHEWPKSIPLTLCSEFISQYHPWLITEVRGCALPQWARPIDRVFGLCVLAAHCTAEQGPGVMICTSGWPLKTRRVKEDAASFHGNTVEVTQFHRTNSSIIFKTCHDSISWYCKYMLEKILFHFLVLQEHFATTAATTTTIESLCFQVTK